MSNDVERLETRVEELERETARLRAGANHPGSAPSTPPRGNVKTVRKRSKSVYLGLPLWEIASGPDLSQGESRGHARAIFAVGDVADGVVAIGGIARGGLCIGGVAMGLLCLGGVSLSLLGAIGGVAVAPLAYGGAAVGGVAMGGAAVGVYAKGDAATGLHAMDRKEQDPTAVQFFDRWLPGGVKKPEPK